MPDNLSARANASGTAVDLKITEASGKQAAMTVPVDEAGFVAVGVLAAAVECARKSGKLAHLAQKIDPEALHHMFVEHAHAVAVSDAAHNPDLAVLVFAIGGTELAIGIPKAMLGALGTSLMTLSASGPAN